MLYDVGSISESAIDIEHAPPLGRVPSIILNEQAIFLVSAIY